MDNAEDETLMRKPDDGEPFNAIKAIAGDMMSAIKGGDEGLLKGALEALCEYIKEEDKESDEQLLHEEPQS